MSTRAFSAPVFGVQSVTTVQLNAGQNFTNGSDWAVSAYSGFPLTATLFTIEGSHIPWAGGWTGISAGEVAVRSIGGSLATDSYLLEGAAARWERNQHEVIAYAGRSKYPAVLRGFPATDPELGGVEYLRRTGSNRMGGAIVGLHDAATPDGRPARFVTRADYEHDFSPATIAFGKAYLSDRGGTGFRLGTRHTSFRSEITASIYTFGDDFPLVYPLFRAGESGFDLDGSYRLTEFSRTYGAANYITSEKVRAESDFRGHIGYSYSFGSNGPYLDAAYHRDELTHEQLTARRQNVLADRLVLSMTRASMAQSLAVRLDHVERRDEPNRTQLLAVYARLVGTSSSMDSALVLQNEEDGPFGVTVEANYERLVRWPYAVLTGVGAAFLDSGGVPSGEGAARLGLTRRFSGQRSGWYARVEGRTGFPIGLRRSQLASRALTLSFGNRLGWTSMAQARNVFAALLSPSSFGTIEGMVTHDGKGVANLPILIDGERRTVTDSTGSYRIARMPTGPVTVSVDTSVLEQGFTVAGAATRRVLIAPQAVARIDFAIEQLLAFAGSIVICRDGTMTPIVGARLALLGEQFVQTAETSSVGAFEFDQVPAGRYELVIDPASIPQISAERIPRRRIDLHEDVLGHVIALDCPGLSQPSSVTAPAAPPGKPGEVRGTVVINGEPAAGAAVLVNGQRRTAAAANGTFALALAPGDYLLSVDIEDARAGATRSIEGEANRRVTVQAGETVTVPFNLRREVSFEGAVVFCRGGVRVPLAGARLSLLGPHHAQTTTGAGGLFRFAAVPAGQYLLSVDAKSASGAPRLPIDLTHDVSAFEVTVGCAPP